MQQDKNLFNKVSNFFFVRNPNIKNSEIVNHFEKEGIA